MSSPSQFPTHYGHANASDVNWSRSEKAVARKAFDAALRRELQVVMRKAKQMASQIKQPGDLWDLEQ